MLAPARFRFLAPCLILFLGSAVWATDPPKPADREAVLAKLKANKVSLTSLTIGTKDGGPVINLGTGENGSLENNATDENLRLIAQLPEVERVFIYEGKYTKDGLSALSALPKLRGLQIYKSDVPADALAVLPKLTQLKSLDLGEYPVTDEILGYAGQIKGLKSFGQTKSAATPAGFLKFLEGVESLEQLTLFGDFVDDACLKRLGQMKDMKRLWTNTRKATSAGWGQLAELTNMQDLNLSETTFGDDDMRVLEGMKDLKSLILNKTKISDAGMPSLAGLTKLHDLGLEGTIITDKGMAVLKDMTELDNLYVGMTDVTAKGLAVVPRKERMAMMRAGNGAMTAKQLDELMTMYPTTQIFDPSGYWTTERIKGAMKGLGKEWPPEPEAVRKLKALGYTLDKQNEHGDVALYFGGPLRKPPSAEVMTLLARIPNLISLTFQEGNLTRPDLQAIAAAPRLKSLTIRRGILPDDAAKELSASASIERLMFDRGLTAKPFGDTDLADLAKIKTLKSLELRFPVSPTAKGLEAIAALPNLELLWLTNPELDDEGLKALAALAPRLKSLALDSRKLTPGGWNALGQFNKLESLWLMDSSIDGQSLGGIGKLTELRTLTLARTGVSDEGLKPLAGLKKLKTLILSETMVTDEGLKHLENLTSLVELQIGNTAITAKGVMYLEKSQGMGMVLGRGSKIADADMPKLEKLFPNSEIVSGSGLFNGAPKKEPGKELPRAPKEKDVPEEPKLQDIDSGSSKGKDQDQKLTNSLGMQFVEIPAGEFQMGITENDAERLIQRRLVDWPLGDWEKQVHKVKLTKDYYIGKHEVTVGQFRKFVEATKYETNAEDGFNAVRTSYIEGAITAGTWRDPQFKQGEDHPVVCVTSVDAQKFIDWLNKTDKKKPEGWEYRLPTEAEWEYAARGSKGTKYPWGDDWKEGCSRPAPDGLCFNLFKPEFLELRTLPVGSFSPKGDSPFGVCDMSGNVSEWCLDWYEDNYPKKDQVDPLGPVPGTISRNGIYASPYTRDEEDQLRIQQTMRSKVFKGDSWYDGQRYMSIAQRRNHPYGQRSYIGFRVALAPVVADRKWPTERAVPQKPGVDIMAPTKSSRERIATFKADVEVTEQLYKEIVAADRMGILVSLETKPERAIHKYYALLEDLALRCNLSNRSALEQRPPTVGELGLMLLAGSDPRMPTPITRSPEKGCVIIKGSREIVIDEVKSRRVLLRKLLKSWMLVWLPGQEQFTSLAREYDFKDLASEFAAGAVDPDTKPEMRYNYLTALIDLGDEEQLESLVPLLSNQELLPASVRKQSSSRVDDRLPQQWRDLTLIILIRLAGENPKDYGLLPSSDNLNPTHENRDLAFPNEAARQKALTKWTGRESSPKRIDSQRALETLSNVRIAGAVKTPQPANKLPPLPGKAPVFARITKVDPAKGTFNYVLLFDEIVNTETIVTDNQGKTLKQSSNRVMTGRLEEKTDRPLMGSIVSTGDGQIIPIQNLFKDLPGKLVIFCDDFDGLHPVYRKLLAAETLIIEPEKKGGLRQ